MQPSSACGEQVHGYFIPPPSSWPGRELRKYHYCLWRIIAHTGAARIYVLLDMAAGQMDSRLPPEEREGLLCSFQGADRDVFIG